MEKQTQLILNQQLDTNSQPNSIVTSNKNNKYPQTTNFKPKTQVLYKVEISKLISSLEIDVDQLRQQIHDCYGKENLIILELEIMGMVEDVGNLGNLCRGIGAVECVCCVCCQLYTRDVCIDDHKQQNYCPSCIYQLLRKQIQNFYKIKQLKLKSTIQKNTTNSNYQIDQKQASRQEDVTKNRRKKQKQCFSGQLIKAGSGDSAVFVFERDTDTSLQRCIQDISTIKNNVDNQDKNQRYFIKKFGYRQCPQCQAIIQRTQGCFHTTCICRYQFCYLCGQKWQDLHLSACIKFQPKKPTESITEDTSATISLHPEIYNDEQSQIQSLRSQVLSSYRYFSWVSALSGGRYRVMGYLLQILIRVMILLPIYVVVLVAIADMVVVCFLLRIVIAIGQGLVKYAWEIAYQQFQQNIHNILVILLLLPCYILRGVWQSCRVHWRTFWNMLIEIYYALRGCYLDMFIL